MHRSDQQLFTDDDIAFVKSVASILSGAIARAQVERERDTLVGSSGDVIARFDRELRHTAVNPALERLTGLPAASLLGKTSREVGLLPNAHAATWERVLRLAWRTGREQTIEFPVPTPSGDRYFQTRIIAELGPDGRAHALLAIGRDVTEQRNAEAERLRWYPELVSQQARLTELIARLERNRARDQQLAAGALEVAQLTPRQREILSLLAKGWMNRRIAHELNLAPGTIKNQVARILAVLGATDRTEAAVRAVSLGVVADD